MIYWCEKCKIPILSEKNEGVICPNCNSQLSLEFKDIRPVFFEEKLLLSIITKEKLYNKDLWHLYGSIYMVEGEKRRIDYINKGISPESVLDEFNNKIKSISYKDDFSLFIECNKEYIIKKIQESHDFIQSTINKFKTFIPIVSFSGGKDSTVVSDLVTDAMSNKKIIHIFGDTTLEFPFTYKYLEAFKNENEFTPIIEGDTDKDFMDLCEVFGPPSRVVRWCCSMFKTGPISQVLHKFPADNVLTFYGVRKSESQSRSKYKKVSRSPKIPKQIVASPILDWLDVDVWLYLLFREVKFNYAYKLGFTRVGCWCCPNNSKRSELLSSIFMKQEYDKWYKFLLDFSEKIGKEDYKVYVNEGKWKARQGGYGLDNSQTEVKSKDCNEIDNAKNYILNKSLTKDILEYFKPFGKIKIIKSDKFLEAIITFKKENILKIQGNLNSKILKVTALTENNTYLLFQRVDCQVRKYQSCVCCSACDSTCPVGAISTINNKYTIDEEICNHCKKCVAKFSGGCLVNEALYQAKKAKED
ncbi:phosphoadenosine phosphosulfate reductase family protein [Orenia marismortui]|uniref:Phosphoadenosine phosphosulfate reductase n=1 Tax=Orenia marismortui TaxID=46469 RepID=A0A4V3GYL1_9FIRM|nr:phosphoadenosine phosphosulfate reductase family protein [Orenia marismortui]TDX53241.1 phosphoadenosine phosphosulfate reductase [Orenia marismortui]